MRDLLQPGHNDNLYLIILYYDCFYIRELLRRVVSNKMKESNPKCQVAVDIRGDYAKPDIKLKLSE